MQSALVTGASRGLGEGIVQYLLDQDFKVFATDLGGSTPDISHQNLVVLDLDVSSDSSIESAYKKISQETQSLKYLINNAAVNKDTATKNQKDLVCKLEQLNREFLLKMFDINTVGPLIVTQKFLPLLNDDPSFVINISSQRASYEDESPRQNYGYRASKIALNMMTFCSVGDLPENVQTFAVHPGFVKTPMNPTASTLPYDQAQKIIDITKNWDKSNNGLFLQTDGVPYQK